MVQVPKKFQFTQSSQCINTIFKGILYLLDGNLFIGLSIHGRAHNSICSSAYRLDGDVFCVNLKQGLPHGIIMLSFSSDPVWRLNRSRHSLQINSNNLTIRKYNQQDLNSCLLGFRFCLFYLINSSRFISIYPCNRFFYTINFLIYLILEF